MKLVAAGVLFVSLIVVGTWSCSIDHRSDGLACDNGQVCANGRVCVDGYCIASVVVVDGHPMGSDAPLPIDAANDCPPGCTSCVLASMECFVDCAQTNCANQIKCPAGWHCGITCSDPNDCRNGVNCLDAASCTVECSGDSSCRNVVCGAGPCTVSCSGTSSCRGIQCGSSCACDVTCGPQSLCENVLCESFQCASQLGGCTSSPIGCNTCP